MAAVIHLDTHVLVWLAAGEFDRFAPAGRVHLDTGDLVASPMALLELQFLYEAGRLGRRPAEIVDHLRREFDLGVADSRLATVVAEASECGWTRDPFDRMIVGHARANKALLLTKDRTIRANVDAAFW